MNVWRTVALGACVWGAAAIYLAYSVGAGKTIDGGAVVGHVITVTGLILTASLLVYQLGQQHSASLKLQRDNRRTELKLDIYQRIVGKVRAATDLTLDLKNYAQFIPIELRQYLRDREAGAFVNPVSKRAKTLLAMQGKAGEALTDVITEIEIWETSLPSGEVFRMGFSCASHDVRVALIDQLFPAVCVALPIDELGPGLADRPLELLTPEHVVRIEQATEQLSHALDDVLSFLHDLVIESQNTLLGDLFPPIPPRQPIDPVHRVITHARIPELKKYFQTETAYGRAGQAATAALRADA